MYSQNRLSTHEQVPTTSKHTENVHGTAKLETFDMDKNVTIKEHECLIDVCTDTHTHKQEEKSAHGGTVENNCCRNEIQCTNCCCKIRNENTHRQEEVSLREGIVENKCCINSYGEVGSDNTHKQQEEIVENSCCRNKIQCGNSCGEIKNENIHKQKEPSLPGGIVENNCCTNSGGEMGSDCMEKYSEQESSKEHIDVSHCKDSKMQFIGQNELLLNSIIDPQSLSYQNDFIDLKILPCYSICDGADDTENLYEDAESIYKCQDNVTDSINFPSHVNMPKNEHDLCEDTALPVPADFHETRVKLPYGQQEVEVPMVMPEMGVDNYSIAKQPSLNILEFKTWLNVNLSSRNDNSLQEKGIELLSPRPFCSGDVSFINAYTDIDKSIFNSKSHCIPCQDGVEEIQESAIEPPAVYKRSDTNSLDEREESCKEVALLEKMSWTDHMTLEALEAQTHNIFSIKRNPVCSWQLLGVTLRCEQITKCIVKQFFADLEIRAFVKLLVRNIHINNCEMIICAILERYNERSEHEHEPPQIQDQMRQELLRLASFRDYQGNGFALRLAQNGFYHDSSQGPNATRCAFCGFTFLTWEIFDDITSIHRCMFPQSQLPNNIPLMPDIPNDETAARNVPASNATTSSATDLNEALSLDFRSFVLPNSCVSQTLESISGGACATAGTQHCQSSKPKDCSPNARAEHPAEVHEPRRSAENATPVSTCRYQQYLTAEQRRMSFTSWPTYLDQTPRQMAEAGFFYVGIKDYTQCYACNIILEKWNRGEHPLAEHARHSPRCPHVLCLTTERTVEEIVRRDRENMTVHRTQPSQLPRERAASIQIYDTTPARFGHTEMIPFVMTNRCPAGCMQPMVPVCASAKLCQVVMGADAEHSVIAPSGSRRTRTVHGMPQVLQITLGFGNVSPQPAASQAHLELHPCGHRIIRGLSSVIWCPICNRRVERIRRP